MLFGKIYSNVGIMLNRCPRTKNFLKKFVFSAPGRFIWNLMWSIELMIKDLNKKKNLKGLIFVNPKRIKCDVIGFYKDPKADKGAVIPGDWDKTTKKIKFELLDNETLDNYDVYGNVDVFNGFYERIVLNKAWKETKFYSRCLQRLAEGKKLWGFGGNSANELNSLFEKYDYLIEKIRVEGYKTQHQLGGDIEDEVSVLIGRNGEILFNDGIHRFSIARLLDIEQIPVMITARHLEWVKFRETIISQSKLDRYQPLTHPDLKDIPTLYGLERWKVIIDNVSAKSGRVLDIGAKWGFFCIMFEELGYECTAVEYDPRALFFLKKLKISEEKKFKVVEKSIFNYSDEKEFDIVLALNIFHHFLVNKKEYKKLIMFINKLKAKELFLSIPNRISQSDISGNRPYIDFTADEFVDVIVNNSPTLNNIDKLGLIEGRPLFKLYS